MKIETFPLILGVLVGLLGLALVLDGWIADDVFQRPERRRKERLPRNRAGEVTVGLGVMAMAASLLGRDNWRYGTVAVMVGAVALLLGIVMNRAYLKQAMHDRGKARRRPGQLEKTPPATAADKLRIR